MTNDWKNWFKGLNMNSIWNDEDAEIRVLQRALTALTALKCAATLYSVWSFRMVAGIAAEIPGADGLSSFMGTLIGVTILSILFSIATMAAIRARSEYGWLGAIVISAQMLFSFWIPVSILGFYVLFKPTLRAKFTRPIAVAG